MSRTDKTNPYWMQVMDPPKGVIIVAHHRCGNGRECDLGIHLPCIRGEHGARILKPHCSLWPKRYRCDKIFGRHPKRATRKAMGRSAGLRQDLVHLRRQWLREPEPDTIDSLQGAPINHRYLYDPWDWD